MQSRASNQAAQRGERHGSEPAPPAKRRITSNSPELGPAAPATTSSIFGGGQGWVDVAQPREGRGALGADEMLSSASTAAAKETAVSSGTAEPPDMATLEAQDVVFDRLFSERIVTVLVGSSHTSWRLHENLLSASSEFFRSAFNSGFREAREDKLHLPEDDPAAFELFVRWLYGRAIVTAPTPTLPGAQQQQQPPPPPPPAGQGQATTMTQTTTTAIATLFHTLSPPPTMQTWLRLYALACKLLVEELENICVGAAWRYYSVGTRRPDVRDVQFIYETTPPGSGMRRLLRERLALGMFRGRQNNPVTAEWRNVLNETPDLGFDIISEISGYHWISGGNAPTRTGSEECTFHRHEKGEGCRPG